MYIYNTHMYIYNTHMYIYIIHIYILYIYNIYYIYILYIYRYIHIHRMCVCVCMYIYTHSPPWDVNIFGDSFCNLRTGGSAWHWHASSDVFSTLCSTTCQDAKPPSLTGSIIFGIPFRAKAGLWRWKTRCSLRQWQEDMWLDEVQLVFGTMWGFP